MLGSSVTLSPLRPVFEFSVIFPKHHSNYQVPSIRKWRNVDLEQLGPIVVQFGTAHVCCAGLVGWISTYAERLPMQHTLGRVGWSRTKDPFCAAVSVL